LKRTPIFVLFFLSILVLTIIGATFLLPAYATSSLTLVITPSTVPLNVGIVFSGVLTPIPAPPGDEIYIPVFKGAGCATSSVVHLVNAGSTDTTGQYTYTLPASALGVGSYSARAAVKVALPPSILSPCEPFSIVPALPPPAIKETDWAIAAVGTTPKHPQAGDSVTLGAILVAISSTVSFPQSVVVGCTIDGIPWGGGTILYPGPKGTSYIVSAQTLS